MRHQAGTLTRPHTGPHTGLLVAMLAACLASASAFAHFGPLPPSLKGVRVPEVPGLLDGEAPIVVDRNAAIALGKALFWDTQVGSDGMACASCHYSAGADLRVKNQLAPRGRAPGADIPDTFEAAPDGTARGPNWTLSRSDFPFHRRQDPLDFNSPVTWVSNDVAASSGTFGGALGFLDLGSPAIDDCTRVVDPVFHVGASGTRRVEPRNALTVINAVFNHRVLWDGRASNVFNGVNELGERDRDAGVWVNQPGQGLVKERLRLPNSALASQAVMPAIDTTEMSCEGRAFPDLGRKLLFARPLAQQDVHWQDSVLAPLANSRPGVTRKGLRTFYLSMIRKAFHPRFWSSPMRGPFGAPPPRIPNERPLAYWQVEANFALFFGIAIQMYESTLVSDDSPFDRSARDAEGLPVDLPPEALAGLEAFRVAHCNICHLGPAFTSAAIVTNAELVASNPTAFGNQTFTVSTSRSVVTRQLTESGAALVDTGFANSGVADPANDPGLGGHDTAGNPIDFASQYLGLLAGDEALVLDSVVREVRACDLQTPLALNTPANSPVVFTRVQGLLPQGQDTTGCFNRAGAWIPTPAAVQAALANPDDRRIRLGIDGAFKVPTLRNVELTGPFMHNGSMATLEEVIEFYTRGGNVKAPASQTGFVFDQGDLAASETLRNRIIAFLESLTDERVRHERAPFDHPAIRIPHGHVGDAMRAQPGNPLGVSLATDEYLDIPAVGANGREAPLPRFEDLLAP